MNYTYNKTFFSLLLLICSLPTSAADVDFHMVNNQDDWNRMVTLAQSSSKQLFVDLYTDWCGYCKMMDRDVFADEEVADYINTHFISLKIDGDGAFGEQLGANHDVTGFPTYLFFAGDGDTYLGEIVGYNEKEEFLGKTGKIRDFARLVGTTDPSRLSRADKMTFAIQTYQSNESRGNELASDLIPLTRSEMLSASTLDFMATFTSSATDMVYKFIKANKSDFISVHGQDGLDRVVGNVYNVTLGAAIDEESPEVLQTVMDDILPLYVDSPEDLVPAKFTTKKLYHAYTEDWQGYKSVVETYGEGEGGDVEEYWYLQAYEIVEDYGNESEAMQLTFAWLDKSLEEVEDYETYYLYAYALGIQGELDRALVKATKAKEWARDDEQREASAELISAIDSN